MAHQRMKKVSVQSRSVRPLVIPHHETFSTTIQLHTVLLKVESYNDAGRAQQNPSNGGLFTAMLRAKINITRRNKSAMFMGFVLPLIFIGVAANLPTQALGGGAGAPAAALDFAPRILGGSAAATLPIALGAAAADDFAAVAQWLGARTGMDVACWDPAAPAGTCAGSEAAISEAYLAQPALQKAWRGVVLFDSTGLQDATPWNFTVVYNSLSAHALPAYLGAVHAAILAHADPTVTLGAAARPLPAADDGSPMAGYSSAGIFIALAVQFPAVTIAGFIVRDKRLTPQDL